MMMKSPMRVMMRNQTDPVADHRSWVDLYNETVRIASAGFPKQLTVEQWDAYLLIPDLLDRCKESFELVPEAVRPLHYLLV
jgi:hypothetical protein